MSNIRDEIIGGVSLGEDRVLVRLADAFDYIMDYVRNLANLIVRQSKQINYAVGTDLDRIAALFRIERLSGEEDEDFRARILQFAQTLTTCSPTAIQYVFWVLSGNWGKVIEAWETQVYRYGDGAPTVYDELAKFTFMLPVDITKVTERVRVIDEGEGVGSTVQCSITNFANPPNADAWLASDAYHDDSIYASIDEETGIIALHEEYTTGTLVDIYYEIVPVDSWDTSLFEEYQLVLDRYAAAGVSAVFQLGYEFGEWMNYDYEHLFVSDLVGIGVGPFDTLSFITEGRPDGSGHFDVGIFDGTHTKFDANDPDPDFQVPRVVFTEE